MTPLPALRTAAHADGLPGALTAPWETYAPGTRGICCCDNATMLGLVRVAVVGTAVYRYCRCGACGAFHAAAEQPEYAGAADGKGWRE